MRGLVDYRLPGFWRDASAVVAGTPAHWFGRRTRLDLGLDTLDMAETLGGVVSPMPIDVAASETPFHAGLKVGTAVLCWAAACGLEDLNPWAIDDALIAPASLLVGAFGSPAALRAALLEHVNCMLVCEATDLRECTAFTQARTAFAARLASIGR